MNDTERLQALTREARLVEDERTRLAAREHSIQQAIDDLRTRCRPTFPTAEHVEQAEEAMRRINGRVKPRSHHGDPAIPGFDPTTRKAPWPPYSVTVDGARGFLCFMHGAPFSARRKGYKLWSFTDDEVQALLGLLRDRGYVVTSHWKHDTGISVTVALRATRVHESGRICERDAKDEQWIVRSDPSGHRHVEMRACTFEHSA